jgi:uncharacterized protein (UPF0335 family)
MEVDFDFKNQVLGRDLKGLIENIENLEITKGKVSGNSIEVYDKTTETQGSYVYCKNMKQRDEDYLTLLEAIEVNLEILENGR